MAVPRHALGRGQAEIPRPLPAGVAGLARGLGVSRSAVSGILRSLALRVLVCRSGRAFKPTLAGAVLK